MNIITDLSTPEEINVSSLVLFCYKGDYTKEAVLKNINKISDGAIKRVFESGEFSGKLNQSVVMHTGSYLSAERVILAGLGEKKKANNESFRQVAGTISRLQAIRSSQS
ncbi:MAG: hypothetical protein GY855_13485, partial [candidate division Zixibacteria bacterium]|nr:hypothetical protein [candidate division Zixibacteria bacterium]